MLWKEGVQMMRKKLHFGGVGKRRKEGAGLGAEKWGRRGLVLGLMVRT